MSSSSFVVMTGGAGNGCQWVTDTPSSGIVITPPGSIHDLRRTLHLQSGIRRPWAGLQRSINVPSFGALSIERHCGTLAVISLDSLRSVTTVSHTSVAVKRDYRALVPMAAKQRQNAVASSLPSLCRYGFQFLNLQSVEIVNRFLRHTFCDDLHRRPPCGAPTTSSAPDWGIR